MVPGHVLNEYGADLRAAADATIWRNAIASEARWLAGMLELAWDGGWYRRAYFDDGTPLGSVQNEECKLDSLTQSWAVLSGAADRRRAERAMDAVRAHLVRRDAQLVLLLTPPFDRMSARSRLHQGLSAGRSRERRPVHARGALDGDGAGAARAAATRRWSCSTCSTRSTTARTAEGVERYRVEPYAVAADVYAHPMHVGPRRLDVVHRVPPGWMYQAAVRGLLGLERHGDTFTVQPCIPAMWPGFSMEWKFGSSLYRIEVQNPEHQVQRRPRRVARRHAGGCGCNPPPRRWRNARRRHRDGRRRSHATVGRCRRPGHDAWLTLSRHIVPRRRVLTALSSRLHPPVP